MSEDEKSAGAGAAEQADAEESVDEVEVPALSALLKRSLAAPVEPEAATSAQEPSAQDRALLIGVQRKLRQRSKGKFYADGWSTTHSRVNYALVAGVMLVVIVAVYLAMGPMGISLH
ncbi:MAG: hypothetical protein JWO86_8093 [Myxococcaceae bacterium]|nr:hypothetical protein [Myxococcaceae bacterium]